MTSFLEQLAAEINSQHKEDLSTLAIVFPTRRAGLFFKKALAEKIDKTIWVPSIYSIQDFMQEQANAVIPDELCLQVELYKIYQRYFPHEDFGSFLPWANVLLKDFDEVDRNLVHAGAFFKNITDLKELDETFALSEEDEEQVKQFWKTFYDKEPSDLRKNFIHTWQYLGKIYSEFRQALRQKGWAYEGMAYRTLCDMLGSGGMEIRHSKIIFAGLYALSKSEEAVIQHLLTKGQASLLWDSDSYYVDDEKQEAGTFIRKNRLIDRKNYSWKFDLLGSVPKKIFSTGVPLQIGQARNAGQLLDDMISRRGIDPGQIAVLLPDEKMLFSVLYSLPQTVDAVNVTMGYPLKDTSLFNLLDALMSMQRHVRINPGRGVSFYHRHVAAVLLHPYIQLAEPLFCSSWQKDYREKKWIWIPASQLLSTQVPELMKRLFKPAEFTDILPYLKDIFENLLSHLRTLEGHAHLVESEIVFQFCTQVNRLQDLLPQLGEASSAETFWMLFRKIISQVKIPFTGEPLHGLQIMGMLESRILDFKYLVFLSANEDKLPASFNRISFIPFTIRKAFGLPLHEENNAVASYHFYRLLQRSSEVYMLYNTEANGLASGEKSRYISQLEFELAKKYPDKVEFHEELVVPEVRREVTNSIQIKKTPEVLKAMEVFTSKNSVTSQFTRKVSPSALSAYIHCGLRYYLSYVAGLKEKEEVEDEMDAKAFGEVLHRALQKLYSENTNYSKDDVLKLLNRVEDAVDLSIREKFQLSGDALEGKNIIMRNVLIHLIKETLKQDSLQTPFTIRNLEKTFVHGFKLSSGKEINIGGVIDRIDEHADAIRILDYKTGKVDWKKLKDVRDLFSDIRHKEQFQTWFYSYLYRQIAQRERIKSGLYIARQLNDGIKYVNEGELISNEQMDVFEENLRKLLDDIYDASIPFVQTDDEKRCRYCSFKEICNR